MGGSLMDDDWELPSQSALSRTLVLVGRTGNGKSATGNSIIGRKVFKSRGSPSGVTSTCELQQVTLNDGQIIKVIDTPGLCDVSVKPGFIGKEIVKCIDLAKDGIHAVLLVLSVRTRFSEDEDSALHRLQTLFGSKIADYIIIVYTGGDELEENDETLADFLSRDCPKPLKEIISLCEGRVIVFDNKTKDEAKKYEQRQELLTLVDKVIEQNGGLPYTDNIFTELKGARKLHDDQELNGHTSQEISELKEQINASYEKQIQRLTEMVEVKLREANTKLEKQLAEEQAARLQAQEKSNDEIRILRENLERATKETDELRKQAEKRCNIL